MTLAIFNLYMLLELMSFPIIANTALASTRSLAWECYGEQNSHSLLGVRSSWGPVEALEYKQTVNAAKHLLNVVQTNREGIKLLGNQEIGIGMILKILR